MALYTIAEADFARLRDSCGGPFNALKKTLADLVSSAHCSRRCAKLEVFALVFYAITTTVVSV